MSQKEEFTAKQRMQLEFSGRTNDEANVRMLQAKNEMNGYERKTIDLRSSILPSKEYKGSKKEALIPNNVEWTQNSKPSNENIIFSPRERKQLELSASFKGFRQRNISPENFKSSNVFEDLTNKEKRTSNRNFSDIFGKEFGESKKGKGANIRKSDENFFPVGTNWQNVSSPVSKSVKLTSGERKAKEFYGVETLNSQISIASARKDDSNFLRSSNFSKTSSMISLTSEMEYAAYPEAYELEVKTILCDFSFKKLKSFCKEKEIVIVDFKIRTEKSQGEKKSATLLIRSKEKLILKELAKHLVRIGLQMEVKKEEKAQYT